MSDFLPKIVVTSGEPAGVGPDVCLHLINANLPARISVIGDPVVFGQRARQLGLADSLINLNLISVPTGAPVTAGQLDVRNVPMVLQQLDIAIQGCQQKQFDAMVTAPIHKGIINDAGHTFMGHTEYLAAKTRSGPPLMMLSCEAMRVAVLTTHIPLAEVPAAITQDNLIRALEVLYNDLKLRFAIQAPIIAVCGLNPHAGEQGHLGRTEIDIIEPTLQLARASGMNILGPLPADTAFTPRILHQVDAILTMYHDQGLPVLKYASFGRGTNITLGLPIIRTSVDHGTALDLAGRGDVDPGSMLAALTTAIDMAHVVHERRHRQYIYPKVNQAAPAIAQTATHMQIDELGNTLTEEDLADMFKLIPEDDDLLVIHEDEPGEQTAATSTASTSSPDDTEQKTDFESTMTPKDIEEAVKSMRKRLM